MRDPFLGSSWKQHFPERLVVLIFWGLLLMQRTQVQGASPGQQLSPSAGGSADMLWDAGGPSASKKGLRPVEKLGTVFLVGPEAD